MGVALTAKRSCNNNYVVIPLINLPLGVELHDHILIRSNSATICTVLLLMSEVLLYVHRNRRLIRDGSPGRPLRLLHSSWARNLYSDAVFTLYSESHITGRPSLLVLDQKVDVWILNVHEPPICRAWHRRACSVIFEEFKLLCSVCAHTRVRACVCAHTFCMHQLTFQNFIPWKCPITTAERKPLFILLLFLFILCKSGLLFYLCHVYMYMYVYAVCSEHSGNLQMRC